MIGEAASSSGFAAVVYPVSHRLPYIPVICEIVA